MDRASALERWACLHVWGLPIYPGWDVQKNYNTGGRIGYEDPRNARVAHITLLHDAGRGSALLLPLAAATR